MSVFKKFSELELELEISIQDCLRKKEGFTKFLIKNNFFKA